MATSDLMPVDEAFNQLLAQARVLSDVQKRPVSDSLGCILAESPVSGVNVPPTDNSAVDGFAIRYQDYQQQGTLPVSQRIPAGVGPEPLKPGTAARIFTGAAIPAGADTVIMQENTELDGDTLSITKAPESGQNIRPRGQDIEQGESLLETGTRLLPQHMGLLASVGIEQARVYRPLTVAILSTGDELVPPGQPLKPGQIYNSNRDMLRGLVTAAGWRIHECGDVADTLEATRDALSDAAQRADIIITTGGVSVGEEDHIRDAIEALGQLNLWRLAIKPGKPLAFGHVGNTPILGLPGNPAAVLVTFLMLARPFMRCCQGEVGPPLPAPEHVALAFSVERPQSRREFQRVRCHEENGNRWLEAAPNQSSGVLSSACWADGLALIPENESLEVGDEVAFYSFTQLMYG